MIKNFFRFLAGSFVCLYLVCAAFLAIAVNADSEALPTDTVTQVLTVPESASDSGLVGDALEAQPKWMQLVVNIIAFAALLGSVIPQTSERANVVLKGLRWLIDIGAFNVFNARNAKPKNKLSDFL